jgi:hypothetical protein
MLNKMRQWYFEAVVTGFGGDKPSGVVCGLSRSVVSKIFGVFTDQKTKMWMFDLLADYLMPLNNSQVYVCVFNLNEVKTDIPMTQMG